MYSKKNQVSGTIIILLSSYILVYEYPLFFVDATLLACVVPVLICLLLLFLTTAKLKSSFQITYEKHSLKSLLICFLLFIFQILALFVIYGFPWVKSTFSIDDVDAVLFTLQTSKRGAEGAVLYSFYENVLTPSMMRLCFIWGAFIIVFAVIYALKKTLVLSFFRKKVILNYNNKINNLLCSNIIVSSILGLLAILSMPILGTEGIDIYKAYTKEYEVVESELYKQYYVSPDSVKYQFSKRKNLIFIMLESMETNFAPYTPELQEIKKENLSFFPGGESIATQGWTIGSQIAKYCGVPLKFPVYDSIQVFLPNAICMQDLLNEFGYKQLFAQGTDKKFASLENFFETHSNIEMHDFTYYENNRGAERILGSWGIDDFTLFESLKEDISNLSKDTVPFAVYAMTMDTHWPSGYVSGKCYADADNRTTDKKGMYRKVLQCASKNMFAFMEWAKEQSWYENTVFVIQGDHTQPRLSDLVDLKPDEKLYWYNVFINVDLPQNVNRKFSSFDMFPTVMEAIGIEIPGHRLGLGTSILSDEKTSLEILGNQKLDSLLGLRDKMDLFFSGILQ